MASTIKTKNSVTTTVTPTTLEQGELAVNIADKKVWVGNATSTPILLVSKDNADTPLVVNGSSSSGAEIRLGEDTDNGSNYVALKSPASVASNLTFTLPGTDGSTNQVLATNGSGTLSFMTVTNGEPVSQPYTSGTAATWTKPTDANFVMIVMWGGGGSGSKSGGGGGGGGGGGYNQFVFRFADLAGSVTYTVGAGGSAVTASGTDGNAGGNTSVVLADFASSGNSKTIYAYGGGGGGKSNDAAYGGGGGGGGGTMGVGSTGTFNDIGIGGGGGAGGGGFGGASGGNHATAGNLSTYGGGGGSGGNGGTNTQRYGGNSLYGGAGGGGSGQDTYNLGGSSTFGGAGGNGAVDASTAESGTAPAGGGGGSETGTSGAGAAGRITFTYW